MVYHSLKGDFMIKFGPAGNSESFYNEGHKRTTEAFAWLREKGLSAFEYSFGRGVRLKEESANAIGEEAAKNGIALSVHAPYYINLATTEAEKAAGNLRYLSESVAAANWMGAKRVVFHPGAQGNGSRQSAFERIREATIYIMERLDEGKLLESVSLCPETMGKVRQIGDLAEVIELCKTDERMIPAIDFGHLHARGRGALNTQQDFADVLDKIENELGEHRAKSFHVHFSKIEFTSQGEKKHRIFEDEGYGPDFTPLGRLFAQRGYEPVIICESKGTMAEDAVSMKQIYERELEKI
jgi:deoxyribonuclease-4